MFDLYKGFFDGKIPYLNLEKRCFGVYCAERIILENTNLNSYFKEYSDPVSECIRRHKKKNDSVESDCEDSNMRVILVSNDINRIRKSAMILADGLESTPYDEFDGITYCDEYGRDFDSISDVIEIEMGSDLADERVAGNPYLIKTQTICAGSENFEPAGYLFRGLEVGDLSGQCDAVISLNAKNVFVGIPSELANQPEIQRLILERGFDFIRLPDVDAGYYRQVADQLIEYGKVGFENEELKENVISAVIKKCGNYISEECISKALTAGRLRLKNDENVFREENFSDFIELVSHSALTRLKSMTGLYNLKAAVEEYLAIRKEMKRNPKSMIEGKHLIFEGNPGGGKTISSKILSDILASEGITNGTFIAATRKDIIGEYVGHTAPKIAKLFKEAVGGVLFVDEAGFFLHLDSGAYVQEAIKEFVRYMETCRDVTVIFAMYPGEAEEFLELDAGLSSRISATVRFEDYSEEELIRIFEQMLTEKGYRVSPDAAVLAGRFLMELKAGEGDKFGNARDARRLSDAVIKEVAIRNAGFGQKPKGKMKPDFVGVEEVNRAVSQMERMKHATKRRIMGFVPQNTGRVVNA